MKFIKQEESNFILYDTQIENLFLYEYMSKAPGEFVKCYLLALMYTQLGIEFSEKDLIRNLGVGEELLEDCWEYWEKQGIIKRLYDSPTDRSNYTVKFLNVKEQVFGRSSGGDEKASRSGPVLADSDLSKLFADIEKVAGRLLESGEPEAIASWLSDYGMEPGFILKGYKFCAERRKSSRCRYVETVLKDWLAKGLKSEEDVEYFLSEEDQRYSLYRRIYKELGIKAAPGDAAKRMMNSWFDDMGFTMDKVLEACAKTTATPNPNISYVNSVLVSWYNESHGDVPSEKTNLYAAVQEKYEEDRKRNAAKTEENRKTALTQIPELRDVEALIQNSSYKLSKAMLAGASGREAFIREKKNQEALQERKKQLLRANGYPENFMDTIYTCPKCKDTGLLEDGSTCSCFADKMKLAGLGL